MEEDHISALPDDILISIISLLPMREASRTAILSRRWRLLAKCVSNLIFQVNNMLGDVFQITFKPFYNLDENEQKAFLLNRKLNLVPAIDQFLQLRPHGLKMEYLRIYSTLNIDHTSYLDRWIGHTFSCGIEELDISLHELSFSREPEHDDKYYSFPFHLLVPKEKCFSSLKGLNLEYLTMRPPLNFRGFKSLTRLYLHAVKISGTELEQILSSSSLLEDLGVGYCPELVDLRIPSDCFQLEKLGVTSCSKLKNIHVNTPSVTSLDYYGSVINFFFDNDSLVKDVIYDIKDDDYRDGINHVFTEFPKLLPRLEYLEISYGYSLVEDEGLILDYFPQFMNLKKLVISGNSETIDGLLWIISLLKACPLLEELSLHPEEGWKIFYDSLYRGEVMKLHPRCTLKHLKVVKIIGFTGCWDQIDFASRVLRNAGSLETMTLIKNGMEYVDGKWERKKRFRGVKRYHRRINRFLSKRLPKGAKLVLIE